MRLLNTATKQLKSFYGKQIPKYAILSHMWGGEEDEVLFNHIAGSNDDRYEGERRRGYAKIAGACEQAIKDGWEYIWIDTCCINKESSAELSEAINSMYAWYQKSEVCYVYLEDVQSDDNTRGDGNDVDSSFKIVTFEHSRWFTRGWTLQELIAPQYVVFYSNDWTDIGTKASLRYAISAVTRIRVEILMKYDPKEASIAEIMSWAAFRETTRDEDVAYCLMGLLRVNMPLLYGEGNKAFKRLQEEIMKVSDDHSLFAWKSRFNLEGDEFKVDMYKTRGMLADSPWDFRDGTNILRSDDGAYSPYTMTNQGLQIELPLQPIDPKRDLTHIDPSLRNKIFKATLRCTINSKGLSQWIVIYLMMVREGHYLRIFPRWLDKTLSSPDETSITPLLVRQVDTPTTHDAYDPRNQELRVKILPTESGFTVDHLSLVDGHLLDQLYDLNDISSESDIKVITFNRPDKTFAVVIGCDNGIPWLDVTKVKKRESEYKIKRYYLKGGPRYCARVRYLNRLFVKISINWSLGVSVGKIGHNQTGSCFQAIIDIQRGPIRAKLSWNVPSLMSVSNSFNGEFPGDLDHHSVHPDFKEEGSDWFAIFNQKVDRVLDVSLVHSFTHESTTPCIQFSPDGKYLATGCRSIIRIYDTNTRGETCVLVDDSTKNGHIYSICFSPDGKLLTTGANDARVRLWDIDKTCISEVFNGHQGRVHSLCFSPDGCLVVSGSRDGTVRVWGITDGTSRVLATDASKPLYKTASILSVAISPDGRLVAAGNSDGAIWIWDIVNIQLLKKTQGNDYSVRSIVFTPDGSGLIVSGGVDKTLRYWYVNASGQWAQSFTGHKDSVTSVAVSHDGCWLISTSSDDRVHFWDLRSGAAQFMLQEHTESGLHHAVLDLSARSVAMSPAGNVFATGSRGGRIRICTPIEWNTIPSGALIDH